MSQPPKSLLEDIEEEIVWLIMYWKEYGVAIGKHTGTQEDRIDSMRSYNRAQEQKDKVLRLIQELRHLL